MQGLNSLSTSNPYCPQAIRRGDHPLRRPGRRRDRPLRRPGRVGEDASGGHEAAPPKRRRRSKNDMIAGAPVMVRPVLPRPVQPGLPVQTADGSWTSVSYPNIVPITDGQDQRLHWTYRDAWDEACADSSFAGALMIRNHHLATS